MKGFTRVIAVGDKAGQIVDYLRHDKDYDNVDFWFCGANASNLLSHGYLSEPHFRFGDRFHTKYVEALHVDNESVAIVIASLDEKISRTFLYDIVGKVWNYADKVYCFLILPPYNEGTESRNNAIDLFHQITNWSDITVLQDKEYIPESASCKEEGLALLLDCCLALPVAEDEEIPKQMTMAEWATVKQMWCILNSYVINQMPAYYENATFSFHKRGKEESWY